MFLSFTNFQNYDINYDLPVKMSTFTIVTKLAKVGSNNHRELMETPRALFNILQTAGAAEALSSVRPDHTT